MGSLVGAIANGLVTSGTTLTGVTWPSGPNTPIAGDLALLIWNGDNVANRTTPAPFTPVGSLVTDGSLRSSLYKRQCVGGESGDVSLVMDAGNRMGAVLYVVRGYSDIDQVLTASDGGTLVSDHTPPPLTIGANNAAIISAYCERLTAGNTAATCNDAAYTRRAQFGTAGTGGTFVAIADDGLNVSRSALDVVQPTAWNTSIQNFTDVMWSISLTPNAPPPGGADPFLQSRRRRLIPLYSR